MLEADIHTLYNSGFYRVLDFKCRCRDCNTSKPEYGTSFSISFVRTGNFLFNVFRQSLDSYNGCVLISKPGYERTVTHVNTIPDECSIFDFSAGFYEQLAEQYPALSFLTNNDLHCSLVKVDAGAELLHYTIIRHLLEKTATKLEMDGLVLDMVDNILGKIGTTHPVKPVNGRLKKNHLSTLEKAKAYINNHFQEDISLTELARHCHVSLFHFSRIFKTLTSYSPHQFLLGARLKQAELLLKNTSLPVTDVALSSGFNSLEHFTAAFTKKNKLAPGVYRLQKSRVYH